MKRSKQDYCTKYFKSSLNNIKNTWKNIYYSSITPTVLTFQTETINNPKRIANIFSN